RFEVSLVPEVDRVSLPKDCTLVITGEDGTVSRMRMLAEQAGSFALQLDKVPGDLSYYMEAGAAVSPIYQITAIEPAELAADSPTITITPPPYAKSAFDEQTIHGFADLTALQHSRIRLNIQFSRPVVAATLE